MAVSILSLHSYPIKSCAAVDHDTATVFLAGLEWDRQWIIVDGQGRMMTQREYPRMALIQPALDAEHLFVRMPGAELVRIALHPSSDTAEAVPVRVWQADTLGRDEGVAAALALSAFMDQPCRLLRVHAAAARSPSPPHIQAWRGDNAQWATQFATRQLFGFADGFPYLFTNQASLDDLNRRLAAKGRRPVPMNRFRPNVVLQGLEPYDEDYLSGIRLPSMSFAFVKRCARCPMPNIDQATGVMHDEPGLTLQAHRQFKDGILFGVNAIASHDRVTLRAGLAVEAEFGL